MTIDCASHSAGQPGSNKFSLAVEIIHRHLIQQGITEIKFNIRNGCNFMDNRDKYRDLNCKIYIIYSEFLIEPFY